MATVFDNIGRFFSRPQQIEVKQAPQVYMSNSSPFHGRKDTFRDYAKEGYSYNAIVYRCVNEIAQGAATIPFKIKQGDKEIDNHPLSSLLARPNPLQAGVEYFHSLYSYLLLSGNSYALSILANNQITELHLLRPDRIEIDAGESAIPKGYKYKLNGKTSKYYEADPFTGQSDIKHFKFFNPLDDFQGMSPMMASAIDVDQYNAISRHNINLLNNGARPSGAVVFKPKDTSGNMMTLSDSQRKQVQDDLRLKMQGTTNAGKPLLLEGDFDWKEMGMSPKDMDFMQQKNSSAKDIALCFGVPSQLVGIPDAQTYANIQEARLSLYEETIIPLAKRIESDLNEWLSPSFGEDIYICYDFEAIPAMGERRKKIYENVSMAVEQGIISRNEARSRLGLEAIENGDEILVSANLFPLGGVATEPSDSSKAVEDGEEAYGE